MTELSIQFENFLGPLLEVGIFAFLVYVLSGLALIAFSFPLPREILPFVVLLAAFVVGFGMSVVHMIWATLLYELIPKVNKKTGQGILSSMGDTLISVVVTARSLTAHS